MNTNATKMPSKTIGIKQEIKYVERLAVRLITKNEKEDIVIIHVKQGNYYKLPGGGIEAGEDHFIAAQREAMEETGCKVKIDGICFAEVEEWRHHLHQFSYCYVANLVEDTGAPQLSDEEASDGFQHEWASVAAALEKMKAVQPTSELGRFIKERDIFLVETYAQQ